MSDQAGQAPVEETVAEPADPQVIDVEEEQDQVAALQRLAAERTSDLQRLQAEYVNYKKRVDRDRHLAREAGEEAVIRELMPVLDAIQMASDHGELTGGFKLVADELAKLSSKHGLVAVGTPGDQFNPHVHDALMQVPVPDAEPLTIHEVLQIGYQLDGVTIRPAKVTVVAAPAIDETEEPTA